MTVVSVLVIVAAIASVVSLFRHPPPTLDRATRRRVTRQLNRGRVPTEEPDRSAALPLAASRATSYWSVVMLMGLAASQLIVARTVDGFDPRVSYGLAGLLVVVAGFGLRDVVGARLALRRLGAPATS